MRLVVELIGNIGSLGLIGYFVWALVAQGRGLMAVIFAVVAVSAVFLFPTVLNRFLFSTTEPPVSKPSSRSTRPQRRLYPGSVHPLEPQLTEERPRRRYTNPPHKGYVKALGMLAIPIVLGKSFGAW